MSRRGIKILTAAANISGVRVRLGAVGAKNAIDRFHTHTSKKFSSEAAPKEPSPPSESRPADYDSVKPTLSIKSDEELQEEWRSLERRVSNRKLRKQDGTIPTGRSKRNSSAWDAENV